MSTQIAGSSQFLSFVSSSATGSYLPTSGIIDAKVTPSNDFAVFGQDDDGNRWAAIVERRRFEEEAFLSYTTFKDRQPWRDLKEMGDSEYDNLIQMAMRKPSEDSSGQFVDPKLVMPPPLACDDDCMEDTEPESEFDIDTIMTKFDASNEKGMHDCGDVFEPLPVDDFRTIKNDRRSRALSNITSRLNNTPMSTSFEKSCLDRALLNTNEHTEMRRKRPLTVASNDDAGLKKAKNGAYKSHRDNTPRSGRISLPKAGILGLTKVVDNNTSATRRRVRPPPSTYDDESDDDLDEDYTPIRSTARSRTKRPIVEVFPAPSPNKPVGVANDAWKKFAWRNKNKALEGAYRATKGEDDNGGNVVFENDLNRPESATWDDNSGLKCGKCGKMQGSNQGSLRSFKRHLVTHKEDKDVYPCRGGYSKRLYSPSQRSNVLMDSPVATSGEFKPGCWSHFSRADALKRHLKSQAGRNCFSEIQPMPISEYTELFPDKRLLYSIEARA